MKKISDYKIDEDVEFYFLDMPNTGKIIEILTKEQILKVRSKNNIIHTINLNEKESKFLTLK